MMTVQLLIRFLVGLIFLAGSFVLLGLSANISEFEEPRVLVFSKTEGFRHESISEGNRALVEMGETWGFEVDTTQNADVFDNQSLKEYDAVIFFNTSGDILDDTQQTAFEKFIQKGGGFVGIHAAAATEYDWPWYGGLVGAYFKEHPKVQQADLYVEDAAGHPATQMLPEKWTKTDEWYTFRDFQQGVHVLMTVDEDSYEGGGNGPWHPISWYREYDGGRTFYTGLGHDLESYKNPMFLQHVLGGISYVIYGDNRLYSMRLNQPLL